MKKLLFTTFLFGSLFALNASDKDIKLNQQQWLQDLETLVNLSNKRVDTIQGIDKNRNGVRDDVETYVLSKYADDPFQRDMFFDAAQKIQKIITLPLNGVIDEHIRLDKELLEIYTCRDYILYRSEKADIENELLNKTLFKGKVLNTPDRLKAYIEHKKILPVNFDKLAEDELLSDKKSCLVRYYSYENLDEQSSAQFLEQDKNRQSSN